MTRGGPGPDEGSYVVAVDGGYVATGTVSQEDGNRSIWLVKTDSRGDELWSRQYAYGRYAGGEGLLQTNDGGYIIVGASLSTGDENYDLRLVKTDTDGIEQWTRSYGGTGWDWGNYIQSTSDGGYIVTGWTDSYGVGEGDLWLLKLDSQGELIWSKTHGGVAHEQGNCVQPTTDGGYIITGATASYAIGDMDLWVLKTDALGVIEWKRSFGGYEYDEGRFVINVLDGHVVLGSTASQGSGETDVILIKLSESGSVIWTQVFGGDDWDWGNALAGSNDGSIAIVGSTLSSGAGKSDVWLFKVDSSGERLWERTIGGEDLDFGRALATLPGGGYIVVGKTHSFGAGDGDLWLIRTDLDGRDSN